MRITNTDWSVCESMRHASADVRRAQLFAAAMQVCAEKGYHATTIDEIAARANLSKGAVYHHFKSKQDLFVSLLEASMDEFAVMIDHGKPEDTTRDAVLRIMQAGIDAYGVEMRKAAVELFMLGLHDPEFRGRFRRHYDRMLAAAVGLLRRGIERGELRADLDAAQAARQLFIATDGLALMYLVLGRTEQVDRDILAFAGALLDGFAAHHVI